MNKYPVPLTLFFALASLCIQAKETGVEYPDKWDVSGYVKILGKLPTDGDDKEVELDDLSIFVSGSVNKWINPFIEAEYFSGILWKENSNEDITDGKFIIERVYNDFNINKTDRIRVGKFLAPVGYWNLIHAAPLVWTVNRPVSSSYSYSNYITGVEYGHTIDAIKGSRFDAYIQLTDEFDPKPLSSHPRRYNKVIGTSWTLSDNLDSRSSIDFQYAKVKQDKSERYTFSYHNVWYFQSWEIDNQLIYTHINAGEESEADGWDGGGYLQTRYHLSQHWNAYARAEFFHFSEEASRGSSFILGGRYRTDKWGNINIEYKWGNGSEKISDDAFSISYNAMFRW